MTGFLLKVGGVLAFLAGQNSRKSWIVRTVQGLVRIMTVAAASALLTIGIAGLTRELVKEAEVEAAISRMITLPPPQPAPAAGTRAPARQVNAGSLERRQAIMAQLEQELGGRLHLSLYKSPTDTAYSVLVRIGTGDTSPEIDPCAPDLTAPLPNAMCLFRIRQLFPNWQNVFPARISLSSFVEFVFPGTAYNISQLVISAAESRNSDVKFTRTRSENVRRMIEEVLGEQLFLPSSNVVLWGRRLNGPVQYGTYFLTFVALILLLLAWATSVLQNLIVHRVRAVPLTRAMVSQRRPTYAVATPSAPDASAAEAQGQDFGDHHASFPAIEPEATPPSTLTQQGGDDHADLDEIGEYPTPWDEEFLRNCPLDLSDAQQTAEYYDVASRHIQMESMFAGVPVDPPVMRFRRAAARAVANTEDTSILPSFLDAQKNSFISYYDARLSLVRYLLWAIPTLGFIGTILGVSDALSSTIGLQSARDLVAGFSQSSISASMGMAFDTTLVALVAAVVAMLAFHLLQGAEERMLVTERNRAEEEILLVSKSVRKPGGHADLAQQLIMLGINTEALIRDLSLFQRTGPELASVIQALSERKSEMDDFFRNASIYHEKFPTKLLVILSFLVVLLIFYLGIEGFLGPRLHSVLDMTWAWVLSWLRL